MACKCVAIPRQRMLIIFTIIFTFVFQGFVESWTLPKSKMTMRLPIDFPSHQTFFKLAVLPEIRDSPNLHVKFFVKKVTLVVQNNGQVESEEKKFVQIGLLNGTLWLKQRVSDMDVYKRSSKREKPRRIFANIPIKVKSSQKEFRMNLILEFDGLLSSFCEPSLFACFPNLESKYNISEGNVWGGEFDYLQNLGFNSLCPNTRIEYNLTSDFDIFEINKTSGSLTLSQAPDAEENHQLAFNVSCVVENATFSMMGNVNILDINDNAPTTQHGNTTANLTLEIKHGESSLKFAVSVVDKDSPGVNNIVVRIEDDRKNLFTLTGIRKYGNIGENMNTFINAEIESKPGFSFPGKDYNFSVVFEDTSLLLQQDKKVVYTIFIKNETVELDLKELYEINISRSAAPFARIVQLSKAPVFYKFQLDIGEKAYDWLGITEKSGIVFVKDPGLMPQPSNIRRGVKWSFKNDTHSKIGSILLLLTIQEESPNLCAPDSKWCSKNENQERCEDACGNGSPNGFCEWRTGPLTSDNPTADYATCSPDLSVCPDGRCDELEKMERTLCPQDCAKHFNGEVGHGRTAKGRCFCASLDSCSCIDQILAAEMRRGQVDHQEASTLLPEIEISNDTEEETSTDYEIAPFPGLLTDGSCGPGCILFASIVPAGLLLVVIVLVVTRRMRIARISKHKFVSSHISLSGVPSDYVDDRSNSAQESRNTPSETSSFGKASIDAKWEFPRNRLQILTPLGEGEFGQVMKAQAWNIAGVKGYTTVAVKMLKENGGVQEKQDLITEFLLLKEISHPNIVRLLGASTEKNGQFYLIVEFAELGSLRSYLRKRRRHNNCCKYNATYGIEMPGPVEGSRDYYQFPCERSRHEPNHSYFHKEQLSFAWQIAKGMSYLSDMKLVHRDLAARNILLAKHRVVKISDFGLSRDIYEGDAYLKKTKGRVPVKWMAIESLEDQIYTSRSDVWSFGVVLWEIMMLGATPYPGVTPQRLYNLLKAGYRMTKPENCSDELYYLMRQCWRAIPRERPSFKELVLKLDLMLQDTVEYMDFAPKGGVGRRRSRDFIPLPNGPVPTLQYTSVLIENEEEEESYDPESLENIGLARLFSQSPRMQITYRNSNESAA